MKNALIWGCLCMTAMPLLVGCGEAPAKESVTRPVRWLTVADSKAFVGRRLPGKANAVREVNLSFRINGPMVRFPADKVGKIVKKGELLAQIDPRDFEVELENSNGELARAEANLDSMRKARPEDIEKLKAEIQIATARHNRSIADYDRAVPLVKSRAISRAEWDIRVQARLSAQAQLKQAEENLTIGQTGARPEDIAAKQAEIRSLQAAVSAAQDRLKYTSLVAPFAGSVATTYVENYQTVQAKQAIIRLLDTSQIELVVEIPESRIGMASYVKNAKCVFDAFPDIIIPCRITEVGTEASQTTRTYPVTLLMDQPEGAKILPGMAGKAWGEVELPDDFSDKGYEIPEAAVFDNKEGQKIVWVLSDESDGKATVSSHPVTPGEITPLGIRVLGIEAGTRIVTAGVSYLVEGQEVRLLGDNPQEASE
jgi:RND family efflux transporter MFP subunit